MSPLRDIRPEEDRLPPAATAASTKAWSRSEVQKLSRRDGSAGSSKRSRPGLLAPDVGSELVGDEAFVGEDDDPLPGNVAKRRKCNPIYARR
jgi:hypothetical protein